MNAPSASASNVNAHADRRMPNSPRTTTCVSRRALTATGQRALDLAHRVVDLPLGYDFLLVGQYAGPMWELFCEDAQGGVPVSARPRGRGPGPRLGETPIYVAARQSRCPRSWAGKLAILAYLNSDGLGLGTLGRFASLACSQKARKMPHSGGLTGSIRRTSVVSLLSDGVVLVGFKRTQTA